ncbi:hypothetical protein QUB47_00620 [Microcoleus sp. AT9_B5]
MDTNSSKVEGTRGAPTTPLSHKPTKALATSHLDFSFFKKRLQATLTAACVPRTQPAP